MTLTALEEQAVRTAEEIRALQEREAALRLKRNEAMLALLEQGATRTHVADLVGISRAAVGRWARYQQEEEA